MKRLVCSEEDESVERTKMTATIAQPCGDQVFGRHAGADSSRAVIRQGSVADVQKSVS